MRIQKGRDLTASKQKYKTHRKEDLAWWIPRALELQNHSVIAGGEHEPIAENQLLACAL